MANGDIAIDATYSTKPDNQIQTANYGVSSFTIRSPDKNLTLGQNMIYNNNFKNKYN